VYLVVVVHHFKTFLLLMTVALGGCAHVQPWEKEDLATLDEHEQDQSASAGYEAHFWNVREGGAGGTGEAGGGCGCN
jgi:hypothetical protein